MKRGQAVTRIRRDPRHWKQGLQRLIREHNHLHATKRKGVSFKTMADRANFLFHFFGELHYNDQKCFKLCPESLNNTHVKFMVERWVKQGAPASTLQLRLSFLRTFCGWIHKDGMIYPPERYVTDPSLVKRSYAARKDKTWTAHGVIPDAKIDEIEAFDPYVGAQLRMAALRNARVKEAICADPPGRGGRWSWSLRRIASALPQVERHPRRPLPRGLIDSGKARPSNRQAPGALPDAHLGRRDAPCSKTAPFYYVLEKLSPGTCWG
jgi:hypothetical protein